MIFYNGESCPMSALTWNNTDQWTKEELKCTTAFQKFKAEYGWDITEFPVAFPPPSSSNPEAGPDYPDRFKDITSPSFRVGKGTEFESEWAVVATLSHATSASTPGETRRCLGIFLMLAKEAQSCNKIVDCSIKIIGSSGDVLETAQLNQVFNDQNSSWGWNNYKELQSLYREREQFLGTEDTLHIQIKMTLFGRLVSYTRSRSDQVQMELKTQTEVTLKQYRLNMLHLLDSGVMADAVIVCGPKEFLVHVNILAAQSDVFQKIFETQMEEGISRVLEVQGIDPEVMALLLEFIYSGDVPSLLRLLRDDLERAAGLIQLADMYLLPDLKDICFLHLMDQISQDTAGPLTVLAYFHNPSKKIKDNITAYVQENWAILSKNPNFLKCITGTPDAFKEHCGVSKVPHYAPFPNPRSVEQEEEPEPRFRLPRYMKMAVGAYFASLCGSILRRMLLQRFQGPT